MAILRKEKVKFHYTIIASGRDQENISYQIHDLGLDNSVTFINGLPHPKVIKKLSKADLFLLASVEEGISNAAIEAMALKVPVISTKCGGMSEVIINNNNGFLIPIGEADPMASKIKKIIQMDKKVKLNIVENAYKLIKESHLLDRQVKQVEQFYYKHISS